jgi:phospholipid/cholesterol/gamma-HCH transport system permease protein
MRVTEQIDALETLGYDPTSFLVLPRVIAGVVMFPSSSRHRCSSPSPPDGSRR